MSTELSWAHFQELIRIERKEEKDFYQTESIKSNWGYRELGRQIYTKLYDRYLISPDKNLIMSEAKKGETEKQPEKLSKIIKDEKKLLELSKEEF